VSAQLPTIKRRILDDAIVAGNGYFLFRRFAGIPSKLAEFK